MTRIYLTAPYREQASVLTKADQVRIRCALMDNPLQGEPIVGVEEVRFVRCAELNLRRLGGWLLQTLYLDEVDSLFLLALFAPGEPAHISTSDRRDLAAAINRLRCGVLRKAQRLRLVS